jgi:Sodium/calcium exchanger protein
VALVGGAAEMAVAFSAARKNRLDLSVGIALGSASQIALFVGPLLVLLSYVIGPTPMDLQFWPGAVVMVFVAERRQFEKEAIANAVRQGLTCINKAGCRDDVLMQRFILQSAEKMLLRDLRRVRAKLVKLG